MAKLRIVGTAGNDKIDLTGQESLLGKRFDGFEVFAGDAADKIMGSSRDDVLHGEAGDDVLAGGKGNDTLLGDTGNDVLDGGEGIDTVSYAGETRFVDVDLNTGIGMVITSSPESVPGFFVTERDTLENFENVTAGDGGSRLVGNAANNVLTGGRGNDTLIGGAGNDTLIGGEGVDTASYAEQTLFVDVNLASGIGKVVSAANLVVEQDTLSGIENVIAGNGGSRLIGDGADNRLTGGTGRDDLQGGIGFDTLIGGAGNDALDGGEGIDTASYAGQSGFVDVDLNTGIGTVRIGSSIVEQDTLAGIENVTAGDEGSRLVGNAGANVLTGGDGDDELKGGAGNDTLIGGEGADTASYAGQTRFVAVNLANGTGTVVSTANLVVEQDTLLGIENVIAGDGGSRLVGNAGDNVLTGGAGSDVLDGGAGVDTASYAGESDFVYVGLESQFGRVIAEDGREVEDELIGIENVTAGDGGSYIQGTIGENVFTGGGGEDTLIGGAGNDTLIGGDSDDYLQGGEDEDVLLGDSGKDLLVGGNGNDTLTGGGDADIFYYNHHISNGIDTITDFDATSPAHDVIQIEYLSIVTDIAYGSSAADAISQDYLVFVQYGTPGEGDFGTTVMVDRNGGVHLPTELTALFVVQGVEASALQQAQNFIV